MQRKHGKPNKFKFGIYYLEDGIKKTKKQKQLNYKLNYNNLKKQKKNACLCNQEWRYCNNNKKKETRYNHIQ